MFITGIQNTPTASTPTTSTMPRCLCLSPSQQLQQTGESHEALSRWVLSLPSKNRTVETLYVHMHDVTDYRYLSGCPHSPCLPIPIEDFNTLQNWNKKKWGLDWTARRVLFLQNLNVSSVETYCRVAIFLLLISFEDNTQNIAVHRIQFYSVT